MQNTGLDDEGFDEIDDRFILARSASKLDFIYAALILIYNISVSFTEFFRWTSRIVHSHMVNIEKESYLWEKLSKDIENMESKNG